MIKKLLAKLPLRLLFSVVVGIAVAMVLSTGTHEILSLAGVFPPLHKPMFETNLVIISLIYHSIYAVIAAFITAMIAKEQARKAVFVLGTKEAIMWVVGLILLWHHAPPWYTISKAVLGPPLAWLGGKLYELYKIRKAEKGEHIPSSKNDKLDEAINKIKS